MTRARDLRADIQQRIKILGDRAFEIICTRLFLEDPRNPHVGPRKRKSGQQIVSIEISRATAERAARATIDIERQATELIREFLFPVVDGSTQAAPDEVARNRRRYQNERESIQGRLDRLAKGRPVSIIERRSETEQHTASWCRVAKERLSTKAGLSHADIARYIAETWNPEHNVVKKNGTPYKVGYIAKILRRALS